MAKRIGQGIHECTWDFLRVGVRERPAKSPRSSRDLQGERNRLLSAGGCQKRRCRKGAAPKIGLEASEWPISEPCELPSQDRSSRTQAPRTPLPWCGWASSITALPLPNG